MAKTGTMPNYKTVDDYIANQLPEAQKLLFELRAIIKEAVPELIELENYKVPSFILVPDSKSELQLMLMASSKFVSFYPYQATVEHFKDELKAYKTGKGSINFQYNKPLPKELILRMVKFRKEELLKSGKRT